MAAVALTCETGLLSGVLGLEELIELWRTRQCGTAFAFRSLARSGVTRALFALSSVHCSAVSGGRACL
jgi:hypothetical protein